MPEFSSSIPLPHIPEDLTLEQFILRDTDDNRPLRPDSAPWLVSDETGRSLGLKEIRERTTGLANDLYTQFGIGEGDVVLIFSSNHIDYPICLWAVHQLCAIVSPCNPSSTVPELTHQLLQTNSSLIIAHASVLNVALASAGEVGIPRERVVVLEGDGDSPRGVVTVTQLTAQGLRLNLGLGRKLCPGEGRTKVAFFCASSGTTGKPKIVAISHFAAIANVLQISTLNRVNEPYTSWEDRRYRPGDVCLAVLPFYHPLCDIQRDDRGCGPEVHLYWNASERCPTQNKSADACSSSSRSLCKEPIVQNYDLSTVRAVMCAGAPLSEELNQQLIALLPHAHIGQAYGQTESTGVVSMWSTSTKHGFNGGELAPGVVTRVLKTDGTLAYYNESGEMLLKTPAAALGYFGNVDATKKTFVDGWLHTGDQVEINEKNEVIYIDHLKEIMKVRGFQVAPAELEGCMLGSELVADVCVVGIPDNFSGEVPLAFIVPTATASTMIQKNPDEVKKLIMDYVAGLKSPYKHVRRIEFVNDIPKNPSGKLLRRILRKRAKQLIFSPAKL
ncbi:amp dependent CoA ligase [Mycena rosella]|uniref:Amp dependent CoA ligase n=1 Tax=Mycena rosella TaxID=1033263 RepID=A0AAD7DKB8_MYCRO|nr:amp dependent CoA ligase [Mycena rosella]